MLLFINLAVTFLFSSYLFSYHFLFFSHLFLFIFCLIYLVWILCIYSSVLFNVVYFQFSNFLSNYIYTVSFLTSCPLNWTWLLFCHCTPRYLCPTWVLNVKYLSSSSINFLCALISSLSSFARGISVKSLISTLISSDLLINFLLVFIYPSLVSQLYTVGYVLEVYLLILTHYHPIQIDNHQS